MESEWPYNLFMNEQIDVDAIKSNRTGVLGILETFLRKFRTAAFCCMLAPIAVLYVMAMGISLAPGMMIYRWASDLVQGQHEIVICMGLGLSVAAGFFTYGMTLLFIVPLFNLPIRPFVKPVRASWFSLSIIPWYYHNALTYLVRYTFLEFITPTPLNKLFFQMMGMKIGKGTMINTSNISDPCLIQIGDFVTLGGSATLIAHYGMKGMLIIDKLVIEDKATIGLKASLFGDVIIGVGATVGPHEVVLPKSRVYKQEKLKKNDEAA
jgi:hypothetical protein